MEGDPSQSYLKTSKSKFQSTPSAWRETFLSICNTSQLFISIHSLRMEGDPMFFTQFRRFLISIHSLRMEGDSANSFFSALYLLFQSTPSAWRETTVPSVQTTWFPSFQSTPSAWRETSFPVLILYTPFHFNPLPPHGGRLNSPWRLASHESFQSTPSAWRETLLSTLRIRIERISIHSLRMEGDI